MKRILSLCLAFVILATTTAVFTPAPPAEAASTSTKLVAFTFDDGPSDYTPRLLDGLNSLNAKATFFVNGENGSYLGARNHMKTINRMVKEGHQVANHTYSHYVPFDALSGSSVQSQVTRVNSYLFKALGGSYQPLVRTPGGAVSSTIRNNVNAPIILWSVDTMDWSSRNASSVYYSIMNNVTDGSIVLLHDIYSTSVTGALNAMRDLSKRGYTFVTVSELFRRRGVTLKNGQVYTNAPKGSTLPAYKSPRIKTTLLFNTREKKLTLSTPDQGITLYYTTNGSTPTMASKKYTAPFTVPYDHTVRVVGYDKYGVRTAYSKSAPNAEYFGIFDPFYYASRYPEIRKQCQNRESEMLKYFLETGLAAGQQGSPVFDIRYYMAKHTDLQKRFGNDIEKYVNHFTQQGMRAGRKACSNFNLSSYRKKHPDLQAKYGDDKIAYYRHYIQFGYRTGRVATG